MRTLWQVPEIALVGLPWREPRSPHGEGNRLRLNDTLLPVLAREHAARLVDADRALGRGRDAAAASLAPDLLHISPAGYGRLSRALAQAVAPPP